MNTDNDNINNYVPSILNPRALQKSHNISLTQSSIISKKSLSLKRPNTLSLAKALHPVRSNNKENSLNKQNLSQTKTQKVPEDLPAKVNVGNGYSSERCSFMDDLVKPNKENLLNKQNVSEEKTQKVTGDLKLNLANDNSTEGFSFLDDLNFATEDQKSGLTEKHKLPNYNLTEGVSEEKSLIDEEVIDLIDNIILPDSEVVSTQDDLEVQSVSVYSIDRATVGVSFEVNDSKNIRVNAKTSAIKNFRISHNNDSTINVDCEVIETSQISTDVDTDENMNLTFPSPLKRPSSVTVDLEIKKKKLTDGDSNENSKVLILKTNAIEKISHVIVQPPNYKFLKRNISPKSQYKNYKSIRNGNNRGASLKQVTIEGFFRQKTDATVNLSEQLGTVNDDASEEMSKNLVAVDAVKCNRLKSARARRDSESPKSPKRDPNDSPEPSKSPRRDIKSCASCTPPPRARNETMSAHNPRKNVESIHFNLPVKCKSNKTTLSPRHIPQHKIIAGTHFAVDAFSYGEIPNVKHYFLTHFHSDHYSGLKKSFSKLLFCSKITADLCISRLGVNPKNIRVINVDEVLRIEGVEVAAVDANHCPGALMLVFTLPNGKSLLHSGDFRACPQMESYPVFWNKDIHTVYLDTTYCNPRYDFPTQDQSLEAALYILRQKKMALEKAGKNFSSVLIVCGTYTIGKEKFFIGMSRRVGCSVWACPEKERMLQAVEGRSVCRDKPEACQLHVVPMRDLTHEKLRSYLDSLRGAFAEVVAFKPSGWENGKNSSVERDSVTIHGIPYSEHSSFSELIRFVKFLKPKLVIPTVDISGGIKAVQKYFPCPLVYKEESHCQSKVTDYFSIHSRQQVPAVT